MKAIGVVRKIDDLGRLVIPKELRDTLNIEIGSPMEFLINNDGEIVIKKYTTGCTECGDYSVELVGKSRICKSCASKLANS